MIRKHNVDELARLRKEATQLFKNDPRTTAPEMRNYLEKQTGKKISISTIHGWRQKALQYGTYGTNKIKVAPAKRTTFEDILASGITIQQLGELVVAGFHNREQELHMVNEALHKQVIVMEKELSTQCERTLEIVHDNRRLQDKLNTQIAEKRLTHLDMAQLQNPAIREMIKAKVADGNNEG